MSIFQIFANFVDLILKNDHVRFYDVSQNCFLSSPFSFGLKRCLMSNLNGNADTKEKNKFCHHPWSVLVSTVALDQSALEKSFSYCKIKIRHLLAIQRG